VREANPTIITISCFVFLIVLYLSSAWDFALTAAIIVSSFLLSLPSIWLFLTAFFVFVAQLVFSFIGLKLDFIADATVSAYLLFVCGLILYFKEGQKHRWQVNIPSLKQISISRNDLVKGGGILIFIFLISPLINIYLVALIGYIAFLIIFKKNDGRYAFAIALFFLVLCPFLLIAKKDKIAETAAIFTYYFLVAGTVQETIAIIRKPRTDSKEENIPLSHREKAHAMKLKLIDFNSKSKQFILFSKRRVVIIVLLGFAAILISIGTVYLVNKLNINFTLPNPKKSLSPTPIIPTFTPTPTATVSELISRVGSDPAKLKIFVQNGTEIQGLAATTAAKLKVVGFTDVKVGNASKQDFNSWELNTKEKKEDFRDIFKNVFEINDMIFSEATIPAGFDILIIAGINK